MVGQIDIYTKLNVAAVITNASWAFNFLELIASIPLFILSDTIALYFARFLTVLDTKVQFLLVFYSFGVQAEESCDGDNCQTLKIDNIDLQHTTERLKESLDTKAKNYEHKLKVQQKVVSTEEAKNPGSIKADENYDLKGKTLAEKEQSKKSNEFKKISNGPLPLDRKTKQ